jgi:1D-myo-inositol 3-kinase
VTPDFVVVGHLAQDAQPDGSFRLGGTVTFAALLASRQGLRTGIVTSAPAADAQALQRLLPDALVHVVPAARPTIFENHYIDGQRQQTLRSRAETIAASHIPADWRTASIALLGPIADEISADVTACFTGMWRGATPQGWLRRWDDAGRVSHAPWRSAGQILPHLTVLVLSREDLAIAAGDADRDATIAAWAARVPLVVLTDGPRHALVWDRGALRYHVPAFSVNEVDPTGAGDIFAAAFLIALGRGQAPLDAVRFAHAAASFVVEAPGAEGVPSPVQIAARLSHT